MSDTSADKRLYKSTMPFCQVATDKGHALHFKGGIFITDNPDYIEFLDNEIARNGYGGSIYIDPNARTISAEEENPMLALEKHFYEKFQREQAERLNPANDLGTSEQGKLNAASTTSIAAVVAGGDAAARLLALKPAATATPDPAK